MRTKPNMPETGHILSEVFDVFYTGKHEGIGAANNAAVLTDMGKKRINPNFPFLDEVVGMTIYNITDGSSGVIISVTTNTVTATLAGGTGNDWDIADEYVIGTRALNVIHKGVAPAGASLPPANGYDTIGDGRQVTTVAGTAKALVAAATPAKKIEIQALFSNAQRLAIGASTVVEAAGT